MWGEVQTDASFVVTLLGASGVGKTALFNRFTHDMYTTTTPSVFPDYARKIIEVDSKVIKLTVWDTTWDPMGRSAFFSSRSAISKVDSATIYAFDIGNGTSFDSVADMIGQAPENSIKLLVGAKSDVKERQVSQQTAKEFAELYRMAYLEVSAKEDVNAANIFQRIAALMLESRLPKPPSPPPVVKHSFLTKLRAACTAFMDAFRD